MQIRQVNLLGWVGERHNCGRRWQASSHRAQLPTAGPPPPPLWRPTVPHPTASPPPRHKPCGGSVAAPGCPQTENGAWRPWKTNEADEPRWKAPSACKPACRWPMGVMACVARPAMALVSSVVRRRLPGGSGHSTAAAEGWQQVVALRLTHCSASPLQLAWCNRSV